jgi:hypothetical protein
MPSNDLTPEQNLLTEIRDLLRTLVDEIAEANLCKEFRVLGASVEHVGRTVKRGLDRIGCGD